MLVSCGQKQDKVEKIIEDGVEVIVNHLEPYQIKGELNTFSLEEEFTIDSENDDLAELGIGSIYEYDVDSEGNVYFESRDQIFKFNNAGKFVQTISRKGQGPGEYQLIAGLRITKSDKISFYDSRNVKFLFFNLDGTFIEEKKRTEINYWGRYLDNGNFLVRERQNEPEKGIRKFHYALLDKNFKKIKDLYPTYWLEIPYYQTEKLSLVPYTMNNEVSNDKIYVSSNAKEDLEIGVYNFHGDLLKKIRKETDRTRIPKDYKEKLLTRWSQSRAWEEYSYKDKHYFPDYFPPFKMFWVDDDERIFVETYRTGEIPGEILLYIFNPEGIFVGTQSLKEARYRRFKNNRMYCVYRKESGYEELVVFKMKWE
jgi:hypothetical protein